MRQLNLRQLIFMALCCDLGFFAKKLILPAANLAPIGYIVPGVVIDLVKRLWTRGRLGLEECVLLASVLASVSASLSANCIVFHLWGPPLWLYCGVAATSGGICGVLAVSLWGRLRPVITGGTVS